MRLLPVALGLAINIAFVPLVAAENILEIYDDAVNNDLVMRAAKAELQAGQENEKIAFGQLLPQIGFDANITTVSGTRSLDASPSDIDTESETTTMTLALTQALFDMNKWYTFKAGSKLSEQSEITFAKNQQNLIVRTTNAYLDVLRAHNNLESSIAEEKAVKQQLDQTQQRFDVGLVAITDVHESRAVYDLSQVSRLTYEGVLETSYEGLTVLTGRTYSHIQPLSESIPVTKPAPAERSAWLELAMQGNHDLQSTRLATEANEYKYKSARSAHLPVVSLALSHSQSDADESFIGPISTGASTDEANIVKLSVQVPIFTGGTVSANRRQAYAQYDQSRETLAAAERGITQQIRAAHIAVLTSIQEVAARKQSITSAQSAVDAIQAGYNYGTRNIVDVLNAQRTLFSSQRDHANARYDYILRLLELKQAAGVLTPADIQGLNQWISTKKDAKTNPAMLPPESRMQISS